MTTTLQKGTIMNKSLIAARIALFAMGVTMVWAGITKARLDTEAAQMRQQMLLAQDKLMFVPNQD